jgi:hypothetical protein
MALFRKAASGLKSGDKEQTAYADEASTLGSILIALGYVSRDQLENSAREQAAMSKEELIGRMLVVRGELDPGHLEKALELQCRLRSKKCHVRAIAQAELAEQTSQRTIELAKELRIETAKVRRESSGLGYPSVRAEGIAVNSSSSPRVSRTTPLHTPLLAKPGRGHGQ